MGFYCVFSLGLMASDVLAHVAQLEEHVLGKDEVNGSIPFVGSLAAVKRYGKLKEAHNGKRKI
jgi:hypothetical protein